MKFTFNARELEYLDININHMYQVIRKQEIDDGYGRVVAKMRDKFRNAWIVSLGKKERAVFLELLEFRLRQLVEKNSITTEVELVKALMRKLALIQAGELE